jgi:cytochrome b561
MAIGYLVLAIILAITLNARGSWLRVAGTIIAALGLVMMVLSIILADLDGTFAAVPASAPLIHRITPAILNVQAVIATIAITFLLWSAWTQARRPVAIALPLHNDDSQFGKASRGFHWVIAVLMFCLVPIGLFMAILPEGAPERAGFVGAHQSLGLTVLLLVIGRIGWLIVSPPPSALAGLTPVERRASRAVHLGLYLALLAFPISGFLLSQGPSIDFYGWAIKPVGEPWLSEIALAVHGWVMPILFYAMLVLHIGAVLKRHFGGRDKLAVRRMLR